MKTPIAVLLTVVASFNTAFARMTGIEGEHLKNKAANYSSKTLKKIQDAANSGDAVAELELGFLYEHGQGVPQDYAQAVSWYRTAANSGYADAQFILGIRYYNGQGVPQDYAQAASWHRKAADQGHAFAQYSLCMLNEHGQGVPQDYAQAASWYRKAVLTRARQTRNTTWACSTTMATVCRRTMCRRQAGTASPPTRAMQTGNTIWVCFTTTAKACRRSMRKRNISLKKRLHKAIRTLHVIYVSCGLDQRSKTKTKIPIRF